jgi:predicted dehydrogenase
MNDQIRVAIIGCGYWGVNYVRVFSELPQAHVIAACDVRTERLKDINHRFPGVNVSTSEEEVLRRDDVEAVVIATPATTHFEIARAALSAGKHVLLEKPITTTVKQADVLISMAEEHNLTLMVGHTFLFNPGIRKVKEYIKRGEAGHLYYLYARRTNMGPIREDVSAVWDLAPHDISIFNYLLDSQPGWVSAVGANVLGNDHQDVAFITLSYPSEILANIHVSWADAYKVREVVAVGSEERIVFNDFIALERVRVFQKGVSAEPEASTYGEFHFRMRDGDIISPRVEGSEPLKNECSHFLDSIRTGARPLSDGAVGREVVRVMEMIDRSIELHGAPVKIETEEEHVPASAFC